MALHILPLAAKVNFMTTTTKTVLIVGGLLAAAGVGYYFYNEHKKKQQPAQSNAVTVPVATGDRTVEIVNAGLSALDMLYQRYGR